VKTRMGGTGRKVKGVPRDARKLRKKTGTRGGVKNPRGGGGLKGTLLFTVDQTWGRGGGVHCGNQGGGAVSRLSTPTISGDIKTSSGDLVYHPAWGIWG